MPDNFLRALIEDPVAGYWGFSHKSAGSGVACRVVRNGDVSKDGRIHASDLPVRWFSFKELEKAQVNETDSILVSSGAYTGNTGRVILDKAEEPIIASNFVRLLRPARGVHAGWLFHLLRSALVQRSVWPHTGGSAIPNLGTSFYKGTLIPNIPQAAEQCRIAEILDTLDEAIRKTEQVIAKLQQMKQGLLHDLLTRGIDENGELRDPERHPEQFRDSPLGRIPSGWEVHRLGELIRDSKGLIQTGPFGSQLHAHEYVAEGIPVIMPQDIQGDIVNSEHIARITSRKAGELSRHQLKLNDVVIARRGDLSRCVAIGADNADWLCGTGCLLVRLPKSSIIADWLASVYRHDLGQRQVLAQAVGSTMVNLNGKILTSLLVPVPTPDEQRQCTDRMGAIKRMLLAEQSKLEKHRTLKQGLMDDLLTGRVRVIMKDEVQAA